MKLDPRDQKEMEKAQDLMETDDEGQLGLARSMFRGELPLARLLPYPMMESDEAMRLGGLLARLDDLLEKHCDSAQIDQDCELPEALRKGLGELGVLGMTVPTSLDGGGYSLASYARVLRQVARVDGSTAVFIGAHQSIGLKALLLKGTHAQREKWLPALARGEQIAAFALTEPEAGSDAANVQTVAKPDGHGGWVLNGQKRYITNGAQAGVMTVMARTTRPDGKDGITAFIVSKDDPGFKVVRHDRPKMGIRGSWQAELAFESMHLPDDRILGDLHKGLKVALSVLNHGRCTLAAGAVGAAEVALEKALAHCRERRQFGRALGDFPAVQHRLGRMAEGVFAMQAMAEVSTGLVDRGEKDIMLETAMTKLFCSEVGYKIIDEALQLHGGAGYMQDVGIERMLRDARINRIVEGASDVMVSFVALMGIKGVGEELEDVVHAIQHPFSEFSTLGKFISHEVRDLVIGHVHDHTLDVLPRELRWYGRELARLTGSLGRHVMWLLAEKRESVVQDQISHMHLAKAACEMYAIACTLARLANMRETYGDILPMDVARQAAAGRSFCKSATRRARGHLRQMKEPRGERVTLGSLLLDGK